MFLNVGRARFFSKYLSQFILTGGGRRSGGEREEKKVVPLIVVEEQSPQTYNRGNDQARHPKPEQGLRSHVQKLMNDSFERRHWPVLQLASVVTGARKLGGR